MQIVLLLLAWKGANVIAAHSVWIVEAERDGSHASVLIGDFNATPLWPVYRRLAPLFSDAAIAVAQQLGRPVEPTWGRIGGRRWLRIDHAFTRGVEHRDFQVLALPDSDHSAIVVDLEA